MFPSIILICLWSREKEARMSQTMPAVISLAVVWILGSILSGAKEAIEEKTKSIGGKLVNKLLMYAHYIFCEKWKITEDDKKIARTPLIIFIVIDAIAILGYVTYILNGAAKWSDATLKNGKFECNYLTLFALLLVVLLFTLIKINRSEIRTAAISDVIIETQNENKSNALDDSIDDSSVGKAGRDLANTPR